VVGWLLTHEQRHAVYVKKTHTIFFEPPGNDDGEGNKPKEQLSGDYGMEL
jgi:hypothetical protein